MILTLVESAGRSTADRVRCAVAKGLKDNRKHLYINVSGEFWEALLSELLHINRPLDVLPLPDGNSALIRLFICGKPVRIYPEPGISGFDTMEWRE